MAIRYIPIGATTWSGGLISSGLGAVFNNLVDATFDVQLDNTFDYSNQTPLPQFVNDGTFQKMADAGNTTIDVFFDNTNGTIDVQIGTVTFTRGGNNLPP